jgi:hypothetical protein
MDSMSTVHNSGARLAAWARTHDLLLVAIGATLALVVVMFVTTFRIYDSRQELDAERQFRLDAVAEQARMNRMINNDLCEGLNRTNETIRFVLDGSLRNRPADPPLSEASRRLTIDTYRRLPHTDCDTGAKTYFDPPFPPTTTGAP